MPGISDPGYELVAAAAKQGVPVVAIPGPSAIVSAVAVSGLPADQFIYLGFLPRRKTDRIRLLEEVAGEPRDPGGFRGPPPPRRCPGERAGGAGGQEGGHRPGAHQAARGGLPGHRERGRGAFPGAQGRVHPGHRGPRPRDTKGDDGGDRRRDPGDAGKAHPGQGGRGPPVRQHRPAAERRSTRRGWRSCATGEGLCARISVRVGPSWSVFSSA